METINQKYVDFLNYLTLTLVERKSHKMSFGLLLLDYCSKTKIDFYETEINEFRSLYMGEYFDGIPNDGDSIIVTKKSKDIIKKYGSISNYLAGKNQLSFLSRFFLFIGRIQQRLKIKPIIKLKVTAINSLSFMWKFIFLVITGALATLLGYLLTEWYKLP